ncbi:MAK10-like protein [Tanacetum coccineum]
MPEMFRLLRELTSSKTPKKVLVREEASNPVTKNINSISLINMEKDKGIKGNGVAKGNVIGLDKQETLDLIESPDKEKEMEEEIDGRSVGSMKEELTGVETKAEALVETPRSRHIGFYLKHEINKNIIEDLVDNHQYNDSLLATRLGKIDHETYKSLPAKSMYNAILKKNLVKKNDIEGNFVIPCSIGGIKYVNALIDQGSDVNVMPMSFYSRLIDKEPVGTNVRLSLASHSYIYPLGIAEDVLIDIAGYVYPADFVILNIKEYRNKPFILGTPFLTTAKTVIRFEKGTITLKSGKNKIDFVKVPAFPSELEKNAEDDLDPITPTNTVSKLILVWKERIKYHQEKEMDFNQ